MAIFAKNTSPRKKESDTQVANILTYSLQSMNLQKFRQLLNNTTQRDRYDEQFYQKYREDFKTILGIVFAHPRYKGIDTENYFRKGFLLFVIKKLDAQRGNVNFDKWVRDVAQEKAYAARHEINKYLILELTKTGGPENWYIVWSMIREEYDYVFTNVSNQFFAKKKYIGRKQEIKEIIKNLFFLYRLKSGAKGSNIRNFANWLFVSLKHFVNNPKNREKIDAELGIDHHDIILPPENNDDELDEFDISDYEKVKISVNGRGGSPSIDDTDKSENTKSGNDDSEDPKFLDLIPNTEEQETVPISKLLVDEEPLDESFTKEMVERYLSLIPSSDNAEVLRLIYMEELSSSEVAEELGLSITQVYNKTRRGIISMIQVALPEIRRLFKQLFEFYGLQLKDMEMREMAALFCENWSVEDIAREFQMTVHITSEKLAKAYNELLKIYKKDPFESITEYSILLS